MKILIIGATGVLGNYLKNFFYEIKKFKIYTSGHNVKSQFNFNLLKKKEIINTLKKIKPHIIINCVANTNVEFCEKNFNCAYLANAVTVKNLTFALQRLRLKSHLIHISTDQVYNKKQRNKKSSENQINLSNNYSVTKYLGELEAKKYKISTILRTNFFGKSFLKKRKFFSGFLISKLLQNKKIYLAKNITYNPVNVFLLAKIILIIIKRKVLGIYNIGSADSVSKYSFAKIIAKKLKLNDKLIHSYNSNYRKHKRPLNTSVSPKKIEKILNIKLGGLKESLAKLN